MEKEEAGCGRQETHEGEEWQGAQGDNRHSTSVRRRCSCEQIWYVLACIGGRCMHGLIISNYDVKNRVALTVFARRQVI